MLQNVSKAPEAADPTVRTSPFLQLLIAIEAEASYQATHYDLLDALDMQERDLG
jgi:hypothetical protein